MNFNSRAPCGARPNEIYAVSLMLKFQLTCPVRGTTYNVAAVGEYVKISTHVPRAGHDNER